MRLNENGNTLVKQCKYYDNSNIFNCFTNIFPLFILYLKCFYNQ